MQSTDDRSLLSQYAKDNSQEAFAGLVARYINLVYSVALRQVSNPHHAEEITQAVFIILAKKAGELRYDEALSSWLFQTTRWTANNFMRSEIRRQHREQEAYMQSNFNESGREVWLEIAPLLDTAVAELNEKDRHAILLRFYEGRDLRAIGTALGTALGASEEAAKKRVNRAVEKLRGYFTRRGLVMPASALTVAISTNAVQSAPLELAKTVTTVALAKGATGSVAALLATASKGGATTAGGGLIGTLGAVLFPLLAFLNLFGAWHLSHRAARSDRERKIYMIYFPMLAGSIIAEIFLACFLMGHGDALIKTSPSLFVGLMTGSILGYFLLLTPFCLWFYRAVKKSRMGLREEEVVARPKSPVWEYRSRFQVLGLPFIHLRFGGRCAGHVKMQEPVKAWISVSDNVAFGILFAYGSVAVAPVSIGACSIGLFSYGAMAVGALTVGGFAFGIWSFGAFGFGWQASAGCAVAWNTASGAQYAIAHHYALGPIAHALQSNTEFVRHLVKTTPFFEICWMFVPYFNWLMWLWGVPLMISMILQWRVLANRRGVDKQTEK